MGPSLVIETPRCTVFAEWTVREDPFRDEKKRKPKGILRVTTRNKGVLRRVKETFSTSSSRPKDKNVTRARGHYYGTMPNAIEAEDEKKGPRLLVIYIQSLNVHIVARYPHKLILTSPYIELEVTEPPRELRLGSFNGKRLF